MGHAASRLTPEGRKVFRRLEAGQWATMPMLMRAAHRKDRMLMVMCSPGMSRTYTVIAVEFGTGGSLEGALDDHAHQVVADEVPDGRKARAIAEAFVRSWKAGKPALPPPPACDCGPIVAETDVRTGPAGAASGGRLGPPPPMQHWVFDSEARRWRLLDSHGSLLGTLVPEAAATVPQGLPPHHTVKSAKSRRRAA